MVGRAYPAHKTSKRACGPSPIDWEKVDRMLMYGCKSSEIAAMMGVTTDCLTQRTQADKRMKWKEYCAQRRLKGDAILRSKQYEVAMSGDTKMLVFLGKNRLGQSENPTQTSGEKALGQTLQRMCELLGRDTVKDEDDVDDDAAD